MNPLALAVLLACSGTGDESDPADTSAESPGSDSATDGDADSDQETGRDTDADTGRDCEKEETPYNGVDDDCDESTPDDDLDGDGYGVADGDCDDADDTVGPHVEELWYDGVDVDCDGQDDYDADGDGHRPPEHGGDDCDDEERWIHPGAHDSCDDGVDADCDGYEPTSKTEDDCLLSGELFPEQVALLVVEEDEEDAYLGSTVRMADLDQDGLVEVIGNFENLGGLQVVAGGTTGTWDLEDVRVAELLAADVDEDFDKFSMGDVTGDGWSDLLTTAGNDDTTAFAICEGPFDLANSTTDIGNSCLLFAATDSWPDPVHGPDYDGDGVRDTYVADLDDGFGIYTDPSVGDLDGYTAYVDTSSTAMRHWGVGDVDGDGFPDIVGHHAQYSWPDYGMLTVHWGGFTGTRALEDADVILYGDTTWHRSGRSALGTGDHDGDGYDDFILNSCETDSAQQCTIDYLTELTAARSFNEAIGATLIYELEDIQVSVEPAFGADLDGDTRSETIVPATTDVVYVVRGGLEGSHAIDDAAQMVLVHMDTLDGDGPAGTGGDFDGDGYEDFAIATTTPGAIYLLPGGR